MIALAPPLDQTPTFPTTVLVGTLVTVEAPSTAKLAKSEPSKGTANPGEEPEKSAAKIVSAGTHDDKNF